MGETDRAATIVQWREAIADAGEAILRHAVIDVPDDSSGWIDAGVDIERGQTATLLSIGELLVSEEPEIKFGPNLFLWRRIAPDGEIAKFPAPTITFEAEASGRLMLVAQYPGAWADAAGGFDPDWPRGGAKGSFTVAVLVWKGAADDGLALFAAKDKSGLGADARARLLEQGRPPRGWRALWRVGETETFREPFAATESARILCRCARDAAILKYEVDLPLEPETRLRWRWRAVELPSSVGEDSLPTHDYLSIAVEFDNGLDLTYMWSAALPVGAAFRCPLPWWDKRETHQVVRSGEAELGRWLDEDQPILTDYLKAIGGAPPARIVGVWLIAVAAFQGRRGECEYRAIELNGSGGKAWIGP